MSNYDQIYQYFTKPLAQFFVNLVPIRIHPNYYTWVSFTGCLVACYVLFSHDPDDFNKYQWLFLGIALAVYNIMDSMDGIVARMEGIPSCEGEVLDHMIDAVCTVTPMSGGWMAKNPLLMTRRLYLGHSVFLLSHVHHRFSGEPLMQGIMGFGVDGAELLAALLSIIWFFVPSKDSVASSGILFFTIHVIDWMSLGGILWFGVLCFKTLIEKQCWHMLNEDVLMWLLWSVIGYIWAPTHVAGLVTMGWQFIAVVFTASLFFFRTLYRTLAEQSKNHVFAIRHRRQFELVGWIIRVLVFLQILTALPFLAKLRHTIFIIQAFLAFGGSISTLVGTHFKGPKLPEFRPKVVGGKKSTH